MLKRVYNHLDKLSLNRIESLPDKDKIELDKEIARINSHREVLLSFILIFIVLILLVTDYIVSRGWSQNTHIFGSFSYFHVLLLLTSITFLILFAAKNNGSYDNLKYFQKIHLFLVSSVLVWCSMIAINNASMNKFAYPYLIAMFCIASTIILKIQERFIIYILSYIIYTIGTISLPESIHSVIPELFFFALLTTLSILVSKINYTYYINLFIKNKVIQEKNIELSHLYTLTEQALEKTTEELNETVAYEKLRATFFANISHELRTPLAVIFSAEQMLSLKFNKLLNKETHMEIEQYNKIIKQNCYRLTRIVSNLIDITKIDSGYFQVYPENCDIVKVVEDITLSVAKYIESRSLNLIFDTEVEELIIACDPDKIERIILNLLSNAVKFTTKGGSIFVNILDGDNFVTIQVRDTGIGIPPIMKDSIFERFVQVDKTISRNREGSGIGLSLVKSLVELHQGEISLVSEEGKGSTFTISLPKRKVPVENSCTKYNLDNSDKSIEKIHIEFSDIYE